MYASSAPQVLAGDSWVPGLSELDENGEMDTGVVMFVCSFRLVVEWILLQVAAPPTPRRRTAGAPTPNTTGSEGLHDSQGV